MRLRFAYLSLYIYIYIPPKVALDGVVLEMSMFSSNQADTNLLFTAWSDPARLAMCNDDA